LTQNSKLLLYPFSPLPYLFHPFSLPSSFSMSPRSRRIHSTCARLSLSPHNTFCTFFPFLPSNTFLFPLFSFPHLYLATIFLSRVLSLSLGSPEFPLSYTSRTPCCTFILSLSSAFIHLPSALNLSAGIPVPLVTFRSILLLRVLFLFFLAVSQYPALFPSMLFVLKLCRSLSRFHLFLLHSSLTM
jgi:hypothetical protein